ncbi:DUF3800 domain-containing protein [Methylacidiphilum caldifontis]|uniref:DUF3800 domain-containing protein n=1 Tax=Methylacidiphilum caldifontis TaxID=2795386 RepID=A0A4Y8P6Q6_9BACT|nr:DUF3800 domain-containing protein [Methylacidiphilum caldifontis]TFE65720.1 DUF3800 domain-containing protein [Methylacidiphilum caldifontis]
MSRITHVGFADESHWNTGRFRSIGMVTIPLSFLENMEYCLRQMLSESDISEFKWKKLDGAKERFAAEKLCHWAVENVCSDQFRVDVLVWDIYDRRHKITMRDDIANLQRMYYHLFRNVLRARWPSDAVWKLCPDEHTAMEWGTLHSFLSNASYSVEVEQSLFTENKFQNQLRKEFGIDDIEPVSSQMHPLLQVADLFAGLAVFSHDKFDNYNRWSKSDDLLDLPLFNDANAANIPSRSSVERFRVLKKFDKMCKQRELGVSLRSKCGLWTPKPENPINFWMYEPQHSEDKAPQKDGDERRKIIN